MNDLKDLLTIIDMAQEATNAGRYEEANLHLDMAQRLINNLRKTEEVSGWANGDVDRMGGGFTADEIADSTSWK